MIINRFKLLQKAAVVAVSVSVLSPAFAHPGGGWRGGWGGWGGGWGGPGWGWGWGGYPAYYGWGGYPYWGGYGGWGWGWGAPFAFGTLLGMSVGAATAEPGYYGDYYQQSGGYAQPPGDYSQGYAQPYGNVYYGGYQQAPAPAATQVPSNVVTCSPGLYFNRLTESCDRR